MVALYHLATMKRVYRMNWKEVSFQDNREGKDFQEKISKTKQKVSKMYKEGLITWAVMKSTKF